ncbi:hypothetical protein KW850_23920 [Bacillus sp. sid0103]|uniref:hypothetical protein n=1 Tax=Bacillus sp. sid0103 TaxID=2856337 RepID=UPI001C448D72|nr:hypothetical protein [Bacillus sp. sid0103]MBV7508271.1 hypothetical protein [Bacillus sp. sid0103]
MHIKKHKHNVVLSSGPIVPNPNTELISVEILNVDPNHSRDVIVEVKNWTTCPPSELGKFVFLCGVQLNPVDLPTDDESSDNESSDNNFAGETEASPVASVVIQDIPDAFPPITTPLFFRIPAQSRLTILAFPPAPTLPPSPCYEVRIVAPNPVNLLCSSFGLSSNGVPQEGNTVLHHQFFPTNPIIPPFTVLPPSPL